MNQGSAYSIKVENNRITLELNASLIDHTALIGLLDFLDLESTRKRSQLTEEQVAMLADEINQAVWDTTHENFFK